jgi:hypothetical protein
VTAGAVRPRLIAAVALGALALVPTACGGSSSHSSSGSTSSPPSASSTSAPRSASTTATSTSPSTSPPATAPPPAPAGTPSPPDGLRAATGYATYELCASGCSGAVPPSLRRSLHLPALAAGASCPVSAGGGPVKPLGATRLALMQFIASAWQGARVTWTAATDYQGPVLIRGRQLGGPGAVGFGEGHVPYDELQLGAPAMGAAIPRGLGREWPSFTRVRAPGCYAYQVDGTTFSEVIVFRAG